MKILLAAAALGFVATASTGAQTERRTLAGDRVSIYNLAGKLRVQPATGSQVVVEITRAGHDAGRLEIATGDVHGFNSLRVVYPSERIVYPDLPYSSRTQLRVNADGTFGDDDRGGWRGRDRVEIRSSGSGLEAYADLLVSVPKGQRIDIHWGAGEAVVTNVDGDIGVSVAAGRVTSEHTRGQLSLDTGSGGVSVTDAQGNVVLDTGSGGVTIAGIRGESLHMDTGSGSVHGGDVDVATLKIDVGSGGMRLDRLKAPKVSVDAGSGGIDLSFLSTLDSFVADAGSGGVTVRVPATQGGDVDIETSSGRVESDFAVTTSRFERHHLRGRIGSGTARIRIEAGSGPVRLLKT